MIEFRWAPQERAAGACSVQRQARGEIVRGEEADARSYISVMRERCSSFMFLLLLSSAASASSAVALRAQGQPQPPQPAPAAPVPKRRALEIHGQAPAPEVVTVRPRVVPQYTRRVVTPVVSAGSAPKQSSTVVVLPAPLPELRAPQPTQSQKPE